MLRVILESPFAWNPELMTAYARRCLLDSLLRNESPLAAHLLYTQVLEDADPAQRLRGMTAGFAWYEVADLVAVYNDYGTSEGMLTGIRLAKSLEIPVSYRRIGK